MCPFLEEAISAQSIGIPFSCDNYSYNYYFVSIPQILSSYSFAPPFSSVSADANSSIFLPSHSFLREDEIEEYARILADMPSQRSSSTWSPSPSGSSSPVSAFEPSPPFIKTPIARPVMMLKRSVKKGRQMVTPAQLEVLEAHFASGTFPSRPQYVNHLNMTPSLIENNSQAPISSFTRI